MQSCGTTTTSSSGGGGGSSGSGSGSTTSRSCSQLATEWKDEVQRTAEWGTSPTARLAGRSFLKADSGLPYRAVSPAGEDGAEMHTLESSASLPLPELEPAPVGLIEACCIMFGPCGS